MKTIGQLLTTALIIAITGHAFAATTVKAGPRKGRILEVENQQAEFFIEPDRSISIAFYDAMMKAQPAAAQVITATAEAPTGKVKMEFEKKADLLVSKTPLPAGEHYTMQPNTLHRIVRTDGELTATLMCQTAAARGFNRVLTVPGQVADVSGSRSSPREKQ